MGKGKIVREVTSPKTFGIVLEENVNMWNEEVIPSGVVVLWSNGEIETVYEDEISAVDNSKTQERSNHDQH